MIVFEITCDFCGKQTNESFDRVEVPLRVMGKSVTFSAITCRACMLVVKHDQAERLAEKEQIQREEDDS